MPACVVPRPDRQTAPGVPSCSRSHVNIYRFRVSVRQVLAVHLVLPTASLWIHQPTGTPRIGNGAGLDSRPVESRRNAQLGIQCLDYHSSLARHMGSEWEAGIPDGTFASWWCLYLYKLSRWWGCVGAWKGHMEACYIWDKFKACLMWGPHMNWVQCLVLCSTLEGLWGFAPGPNSSGLVGFKPSCTSPAAWRPNPSTSPRFYIYIFNLFI